jgi:DNA-binding transcriptional ArsR family regulator
MARSRAGTGRRKRPWRQVSMLCALMAHPLRYAIVVELAKASADARALSVRIKAPPRQLRHHLRRLAENRIVADNSGVPQRVYRLGPRARAGRVGRSTRLVLNAPDGSCLELMLKPN